MSLSLPSLAALVSLSLSVAAPSPAPITLWRRGDGPPHKDVKAAQRTVDLRALPGTERVVHDVSGAAFTVRGVALTTLLLQAPFDGETDAVILRFKNGTRVQLPRDDVARFDVFIALAWRMSDQGEWSATFEPVPLGNASWRAARALEFGTHRVFADAAQRPRGAGTFNPWGYVDSLAEIELVNAAAWRRSFDVGEARGLTVWENRCQTCHGARGAGARLGWDFVDPLPLSSWRTADSLFDHVRAHKLSDAEVGLVMPPQPDVTREEVAAIHAWMTALARTKTLPPYSTTPSSR